MAPDRTPHGPVILVALPMRVPELRVTEAEVGATDTVLRGDVCHCQRRIRQNASERFVELAFKSACLRLATMAIGPCASRRMR